MAHSTYSFQDISLSLSHPSVGTLELGGDFLYSEGKGVGSITFAWADDVGSHERAADGQVMTSKIIAKNGTIVFVVNQVSDAHQWLTKAYNYLQAAPPDEWAKMELVMTAPYAKVEHEGREISFVKRADKAYGSDGATCSWTLQAKELIEK